VTAAALSLCLLTLAGTSRALTGWLPLLWTGRASRRRFWSIVPLAALAHVAALLLWGLSAAVVLRWRLGASLEVPEVIRVVAVASTPMLLAWLGLFPFLGGILGRLLVVLSFALMVLGLADESNVGLVPALAATAPGGVVLLSVLALLARPAYSARQPIPTAGAGELAGDGAGHGSTAAYTGRWLVYLQGVSAYSADYVPRREQEMLELLAAHVPALVLVSDVFGYDMEGVGLGPRSGFWRWAHRQRLRRTAVSVLGRLINVRNLLLLAVSADRRYAAAYSQGLAAVLQRALLEHGYPVVTRQRVTLIGYSGGAQLAIGAAAYLAHSLGAPVRVISIGGIIWNDRGIGDIEHLYDLVGTKDWVRRFAVLLFPGRWRIAVRSEWNRARYAGRITQVVVGPMDHTRRRGYFDRSSTLPDGRTFVDATVSWVVTALK
jgi:hypothetical protein